jgi:DNA invertase Pin-like site-specific DNA recombinase
MYSLTLFCLSFGFLSLTLNSAFAQIPLRFARSVKHLVLALEQLSHLGIAFVSLSESVDTSTPVGRAMFHFFAIMAELERSLIRERVVMGLDLARKQRKTLGRPKRIFDKAKAKELHAEGMSFRQIAIQLGVNKGTVRAAQQ